MMDRRVFLGSVAGGLLAAPLMAEAQPAGRVYRIGYLGNSSVVLEADLVEAFRQGLRNLNYVEGRNIVIEYLWAEGRNDLFPALVAEAVRLKADVILTSGTPATLAAKEGTRTIPIVIAAMGDPISAGVVPSLARPGGNITGLASMTPEIDGKRLELLKELVPGLSRIAVLWNPTNPNNAARVNHIQAAAKTLRLTLEPLVGAADSQDLDKSFATIAAARAEALVIESDRALLAHRAQIVDFATRRRLPALYPYREFVQAGGLVSYAPSYPAMFRRAATYMGAPSLLSCPSSSPPSSSSLLT
jgi:putative tryptophan/tyrosine transport system substrate-binding protein